MFCGDAGETNVNACHSEGLCKFLGIDSNWERVQTDLKKIQAVNNMPTLMDQRSVQFWKYMALYRCPDQQPGIILM